jgi:hypothetical protein
LPYTTNDARHGGGNIKIDTYVIMPALNCGATSPYDATEYIDIGVLCHELGHTMGLPDLYDVNGGGSGIGHWGIMGSGNWNTPEKPAHMDAWCKQELGWTTPVQIGWQPARRVDQGRGGYPDVYKLPFDDEAFPPLDRRAPSRGAIRSTAASQPRKRRRMAVPVRVRATARTGTRRSSTRFITRAAVR